MMQKISVIALGCNKNQVDAEVLITKLVQEFEVTNDLSSADVIVILPCAFLKEARDEAYSYIQELTKYKNKKCKCLIVAGCYAQFLNSKIQKDIPSVDIVLGVEDMHEINRIIKRYFENAFQDCCVSTYSKNLVFPKDFSRIITNPAYSYLKISEGCNNRCAYCLIPSIRGDLRSRDRRDILKEVEILTENGIKEINIIAQDIGNYGQDFGKNYDFLKLLNDICKIKKDGWIRLLYLHPRHIDEKFVDLMLRNKQICRYLDMPIQHVSNKILKLMNRPITKRDVLNKISLLKQNIPDMILRTTLIIGFPSETDKEFDELVEFVQTGDVEKIGIFKYSKEPGTKAYALKNHVSEKIKNKRFEILTKIYEDVSLRNQYKFIDKEMKVLVEYKDTLTYQSRFYGMAPEVDGNVFFSSRKKIQIGSFVKIKIKDVNAYDMFGELI